METDSLKKIVPKIFSGSLDSEYLIKKEDHGKTYKIGNEYIKILHFKKYKLSNFIHHIKGTNLQICNLKKVTEKCRSAGINIYDITEYSTLRTRGFVYGFYKAEKVKGEIYSSVEKKSIEVYEKAFDSFVKMLKIGVYEYDFSANNFSVDISGEITFIDFDETKLSIFRKKELYKSLTLLAKNFKRECEKYGLNWDEYKKRGLEILSKELNIPQAEIVKKIKVQREYRDIIKKFRIEKRIFLKKYLKKSTEA